jgi:hypothetical protein
MANYARNRYCANSANIEAPNVLARSGNTSLLDWAASFEDASGQWNGDIRGVAFLGNTDAEQNRLIARLAAGVARGDDN